jgi:hypothetical protein
MALRRSRSRNTPRSSIEPLGVAGATIENAAPGHRRDPDELRDLADSVIVVLGGEGYAVGPWTPDIDAEAATRVANDGAGDHSPPTRSRRTARALGGARLTVMRFESSSSSPTSSPPAITPSRAPGGRDRR